MKEFGVNVLGQDYTVKCGSLKEVEMSSEFDGQCYNYQKLIKLNTGDNPTFLDETEDERWGRIKNTAAHEVFHAFCTESGIYLPNDLEEQLAVFYAQHREKMEGVVQDIIIKLGEDE